MRALGILLSFALVMTLMDVGSAQEKTAKNPAVGRWKMNQPGIGESELKITEKDGKLEVQEIGLGEVRSRIASYEDGLLVIHWQNGAADLQGYWLLHLNKEHARGEGKTVFTRYREDYKPGKAEKILDRPCRRRGVDDAHQRVNESR